jgi:hypothetical protein
LKHCETKVNQGFICPDDLPEDILEWKIVCADGCFLNHPDHQRKLESSFRLAEDRLELLEKKKQESIELLALNERFEKSLVEVSDQRDRALLNVTKLDAHIELLNHDIDVLRAQNRDSFQWYHVAGALVVGFAGGFASYFLGAQFYN